MKRILATILLVALAATTSFAASKDATGIGVPADAGKSIVPYDANDVAGPAVGKLSTGVYFAWSTLTTSYAIKTQHSSGTRAFGTASDSTAITWSPITKGANLAAPGAAANYEEVSGDGWTVM